MSISTKNPPAAPQCDGAASKVGISRNEDIVEINLLLPSQWAFDLIELSRERGQSVGQILRSMIGQALHDGASGC